VPLWLRVFGHKGLLGRVALLSRGRPAADAEDYRGRTVTFRGQLRTIGMAGQAGLHLAVSGPPDGPISRPLLDHGSSLSAPGSSDWTWHEVTVPVPGEATAIRFGISLAGRGRIELRGAELTPASPGTRE
jgi:hypothetical protein